MTIRNLEIFVAVCENMNMSAAAAKLFVSQSAVSQSIRDLETHFNLRLFERNSNKLYLTPPGKELLKYAEQLLEYYEHMETGMRIEYGKPHVRIGTIMPYMMVDMVADYLAEGNDTDISMHVYDHDRIISLLRSADLDLAITDSRIEQSDLDTYLLMSNEMSFMCCSNTRLHPSLQENPAVITLQDFASIPLVVAEPSRIMYDKLFMELQHKGIHYVIRGTFLDYPSLERAVINDLGVAIHHNPKAFHSGNCKSFQVEGIRLHRKLYLICHKSRSGSPRIQHLIDFIMNNVGERYRNLDL